VYGSDSDTSSTVVQAFTNGVRISTTLTSKDAGTSFSYPLDLKKGSHIDVQDNGGVEIVGPDGAFLGGLLPPWAKDANGASVPTHYAVHGNSVVQVIDGNPAALAYPVVADPWYFIDLISWSKWKVDHIAANGRYAWTLQVYPTPWAMVNSGNPLVAEAGWSELVSKDTYHTINTNVGSMHWQYDCHQLLFASILKLVQNGYVVYNLGEYQRDDGFVGTQLDKCNPPNLY
jgi:hypothetical protein